MQVLLVNTESTMADVIVLEDDPGTLRALHYVAARLGHDVLSFNEPEAAIKAIEYTRPDVLVTDWDLNASLSGINVAMHALEIRPSSRIILITGNDMTQLKQQTSSMPNVFYLSKPFDLRTMRNAITSACDS